MNFDLFTNPAFMAQLFIDGLARGVTYGLMGMGLALIFGIMGLINFAHGAFFMVGTYIMYGVAVALGLGPWLGIIAAALGLFLVGVLLERGLIFQLRRRLGENWLVDGYVMTIGLLIVMQNLALIAIGPREYGIANLLPGRIKFLDLTLSNEKLMVLCAAAVVVVAFAGFMRFTYLGRSIRATSEHPEAAQALGIDTRRVYTVTFGIGSAIIGGVGGLLISTYPAFPTIGGDVLLKSFVVVIIAGLGNVWGAMIAGPLLGIVEAFATGFATAGWQNSVIAGVVVAVLVFRPSGLFSKLTSRP